jgi:hypothetical protein
MCQTLFHTVFIVAVDAVGRVCFGIDGVQLQWSTLKTASKGYCAAMVDLFAELLPTGYLLL